MTARVREGGLEAFRELMADVLPAARDEPGILSYAWTLGDDGRTVHLFERHVDARAATGHLAIFIERFLARLAALIELESFCVYGPVDDALREMLLPLGATFFEIQDGFSRGERPPA